MPCVKTGCHVYIVPHDLYAYGDAHEINGVYVFRLCQVESQPLTKRKHYTIRDWDHWFDRYTATNSTLFTNAVTSHGYNGVPV